MVIPPAVRNRQPAATGKPRWPRAMAWICGAALVAVLAALLWPVWPALRFADEGSAMGHLPLAEEDQFTVAYVHSIDGLPIEENIEVREGRLVVDSTRLRQFGAGMGHVTGEGSGRAEGDWWVIEGMDRDIGSVLALRVGAAAVDHRVRTPDAEVRLSPCLSSRRVTVEPVRLSTLHLLTARDPQPEC